MMRVSRAKSHSIQWILASLLWLFTVQLFSAETRKPSVPLTELLWNARDEAVQLANDADQMQTLVLTDTNWVTHELMLHKIQSHLDDMQLLVQRLTKTEGAGSVLQEQAVERMLPLIRELSDNTASAIRYLNQNKTRPLSDTYTQYLQKNAETAHELSNMVSSLVDYEESMNEMKQLRQQLASQGK